MRADVLTRHGAVVWFGWRKAWRDSVVIVMPLVMYVILIGVYASIYMVTPFEELGAQTEVRMETMVWYLALTEFVIMGSIFSFRDVRDEVLDGAFAVSLHRPTDYVSFKAFEWIGRLAFELPVFFLTGFAMAYALTGVIPFDLVDVPYLIASSLLGCLIICFVYVGIGLLEVWGPYSRAGYWISQKFIFLLGGLILPITIYPDVLEQIAWLTPFPAILTIPAGIAFNPSIEEMRTGVLIQLLWLGIVMWLAWFAQKRATRFYMEGRA